MRHIDHHAEPVQFVARWDERTNEPVYVGFALDAAGQIQRTTMKPYSPLADFIYE